MLTFKRPRSRPTVLAAKTDKKVSIKKRLRQGSLFVLAGLIAFTVVNPAQTMQLFNALNPPKIQRSDVRALDSPRNSPVALPDARGANQFLLESQALDPPKVNTTKRNAVKELVSERNSHSKTFLNSDGTKTMEYTTDQRHYKKKGDTAWSEINNHLEQKNAADGTRFFEGEAGVMSSTIKKLSQGIEVDAEGKSIIIKPVGAGDVQPERVDDRTVLYRNVWQGVDIEYELRGEAVKEVIIVRSNKAPTTFDFAVSGGRVIQHPERKGELAIEGLSSEYSFSALTLDVNGRGVIDEERITQVPTSAGIRVAFDKDWFKSQPDTAFPMRIDPTLTRSGDANYSYVMHKSNGYSCNATNCYINTGSVYDNGWQHWRSYLRFNYDALNGKNVLSATMQGTFKSGIGGSTAWQTMVMGHASCTNSFHCAGTDVGSTSASTDYNISFTGKMQELVRTGNWGAWWSIRTQESTSLTYKPYSNTIITITYDTPTQMATPAAPADKATIVSTQPTLQANTATDADGDAVQYYFRIATNPDAETGAVINSGWQSSRQYTVPQYILQDGHTYYWHVYTRGNTSASGTIPNWTRSFKVDLRTGKDSTQAYEEIGPIAVDLATGNATTSTGSHSISALGGDIGVKLDYNTPALAQSGTAQKTLTKYGLTGRYYNDPTGSRAFPSNPADPSRLLMVRSDNQVSFNWGDGAASPGLPADKFLVRWEGYITAPEAKSYTLGANADDGVRIWVGTGAGGAYETALDSWNFVAGNRWGVAKNLPANQPVRIKIEYVEDAGGASFRPLIRATGLAEQEVPTTWLAPNANVLPDGWELAQGSGDVNYEGLQVSSSSAILFDSTGQKYEYTWKNGTYTPPKSTEATLIRNNDGTHMVIDQDGKTYIFNTEGRLVSVTSPEDDRQPAALKYEYDGLSRLSKISDGVNAARNGILHYSGSSECQTMSGFDATPAGYLCAFTTTDGKKTTFQYKNGNLARIVQPGDAYEDYQYDSLGRISSYRDTLANDAIAYGVRADDASTRTEISYDQSGKVVSVKDPAPTVGSSRAEATIQYLSGTTALHVTSAPEPHGFSRKITYDNLFRTTSDTTLANLTTTNQWHADKDLLLSTTDPAGLKSTTIYDVNTDLPVERYGSAPSAWFDGQNKPLSAHVANTPHTQATYDENLKGPAVSWYDLKGSTMSFSGAPKLHTTGFASNGAPENGNPAYLRHVFNSQALPIIVGSSNGVTGYGLVATGKVTMPQTATYTVTLHSDDSIALFIDDKQVINNWGTKTANDITNMYTGTFTATAGKPAKFELRYGYDGNTKGRFALAVKGAGVPDSMGDGTGTRDWSQYLKPGYNLSTSTKAYDSQLGDIETKTIYEDPAYGLVDKTIFDPTGFNYENDASYETPGSGFLRQTSKKLAGGTSTQYLYYSATDTRDNPCTPEAESVLQSGFAKGKVEQDPDTLGASVSRTSEVVYNGSGGVAATRYNDESWTCTTFDDRGRIRTTIIPTIGSKQGRTITNNFLVGGSPLRTSTSDSNGAITLERDLLGRVIAYEDARGNTTYYTYDAFGKVATKSSPIGVESFEYDQYDRLVIYKLDTITFASVTYDSYGKIAAVNYPANLTLNRLRYDDLGRVNKATYEVNGTTVSDEVARSVSGNALSGNENGVAKSYEYDSARRLTKATIGDDIFDYEFGASDISCSGLNGNNPSAGKNSNRTKYIRNGQSTTYCYDMADRLISSSDNRFTDTVYDARGNTVSLGDSWHKTEFNYDASDRNIGVRELYDNSTEKELIYEYDVSDRLLKRSYTVDSDVKSNTYYGYTSAGDSPNFVMDEAGTVIQKYLSLPGGVSVTIKPHSTSAGAATYSLSNIHGDTMATVNADGTVKIQAPTGPYGELLESPPDNTVEGASFAYVGSFRKTTDTDFAIAPTRMGARVYIAELGRFLQVDPVEGGTMNDYVYATDPVNQYDLNGKFLIGIVIAIAAVKIVSRFLPTPSVQKKQASKPAQKPPVKYDKPSAVGGYNHWLYGGGKNMRMDAASISFKINQAILEKRASGKYETISVGAEAEGFSAKEHIGRVSGTFRGTIRKTDKGYIAQGVYTPSTDIYGFDVGGKRPWYGEAATATGLYGGVAISTPSLLIIKPSDYLIEFDNSSTINQSW